MLVDSKSFRKSAFVSSFAYSVAWTQPLNKRDKHGCVLQALVIFIKNNFGSKNSTLDSVILSIKKTIIQEQIQKILNYENKSIKAPLYILCTLKWGEILGVEE